jgi:hypothetical protein
MLINANMVKVNKEFEFTVKQEYKKNNVNVTYIYSDGFKKKRDDFFDRTQRENASRPE